MIIDGIVRKGLEEQFYTLCEQAVKQLKLEIYDLEYLPSQSLLRLYIINPDTKTAELTECIAVDHALSPAFETETWIPENITLEVSSPGVYRELAYRWQFEDVVGERVCVKLHKPFEWKGEGEVPRFLKGERKLVGILKELEETKLTIVVREIPLVVAFEQMRKANLEPEI